ncbi:MAG: hypothetical protein FJX75_00810 [Armatimonadetes bacterium]|nr:hypothetical protein [Armatimonadota bacterium]
MSAWAGSLADLGPDREFTFAGLRRQLWRFPIGVLAAAFNIGFWGWLVVQTQALAGSPVPFGNLWWDLALGALILIWLAIAATAVRNFVDTLHLLRRGFVLVSRVGLAFTDGRGRQHRAFWTEVRELRVVAPLSGVTAPFGRLDVRSDGGRILIPPGLTRQDWEELRQLTLGLASLSEQTRKWWGVIYTRAHSS